jgi:hypothetical protein
VLYADALNAAIAIANAGSPGAVNVLDYGADPTGAADSSAAINAAASQMGPNGHRKAVYLPTGTYQVRHQIILTDGQTLFGDGEGSTNIAVYDSFDATASSVILCTASFIDPGPTIRDLTVWFIQPNDLANRSTMKTLAAGGTSTTPGTGVQYPWAIDTQGNSGCVQVQHVVIQGAWNGINADKACYWIDGLKISAFNIGIAIGGTTAAAVLNWSHMSDVEFWTWGLPNTGQVNVYMDGQTIAMRIGAMNGLTAQNISCFSSRLVFTSDATGGWFSFTNLAMDTDHATIEVADAKFLQFSNLYYATGATATKPGLAFAGNARVTIAGFYTHSTSPFPLLQVSQNADVSLVGAVMLPYTVTITAIQVSNTATLRMNGVKIYPGNGTWTAPLIMQNDTSNLQISNVDVITALGYSSSGTAVQYNSDQPGNYLGPLSLKAGWSVVGVLPSTTIATRTVMPALCASTTYANDAAAATGGVAVGQLYRNGSVVQVRVV